MSVSATSKYRTVWRHTVLRLCDTLNELDGDADALLFAYDLSMKRLFEPGLRIPTDVVNAMMIECQMKTEREAFGVISGQRPPIIRSALGTAIAASRNAIEAINRYAKYAPVIESGTAFTVAECEDTHIVTISGWEQRWNPIMLDALLSSVCWSLGQLMGSNCSPRFLRIQRKQPDDPSPWHDALAHTIEWDASETQIAWDSKLLLQTRILADNDTALLNDALVEPQLEQAIRAGLTQRVEAQIAKHLVDGTPSPSRIAHDLNMGTRTLQRYLQEEGTNVQEILKLLRKARAQELLVEKSEPIAAIAYALGYEDPAAFSKAFKTWYGVSPKEYLARRKMNSEK
jgi:AraC-like DNA-binding protein